MRELGQEEFPVVLPTPVNRHVLVKHPIPPSTVETGLIKLSPKQIEERVQSLLVEKFPDATIKYQIVAKADDCQEQYKVGAFISFTHSGTTRPHQMISGGDYMLVSEGDIGLIWSAEAIESNMEKYKKEEVTK